MSGFKDSSIIVSSETNPVSPDISGDLSIFSSGGRLKTFDGITEKILAYVTDVTGGSGIGDITRSEVSEISSGLQTQINNIAVIGGIGVSVSENTNNVFLVSVTGSFGDSSLRNEVNSITSSLYSQILQLSGNSISQASQIASISSNYATLSQVSSITSNLQTQITSLDSRFVDVSGDTMVGQLTMSGAGIQLDINLASPTYQEGLVFYDNSEKSLSYYTDISGVTVNVGQEHLIKVKNVNGSALADGDVVYVFSADGQNVTVKKARADLASTSRATIGVVTQACADNASTYITRLGKVHQLNTSAYNEGDTVYLSAISAGGWTTTLPAAPARTVRVGYITKKSSGDGHILVDVHDGLSLTEVNDVWIASVNNRDVLSYNISSSRWENVSVVAATSGALDNRYTLLTTTSSISSYLQTQIDTKTNIGHLHSTADVTGFAEAIDDRVSSLLVAGSNIAINYDDVGNSLTISATISGATSLQQGLITCDTTNSVYNILHGSIDLNYSFPTISLVTPTSASTIFVQSIIDRSSTSFKVVLSEVPNVSGYYISWHLPSTNASLDSIPVINVAITNIPSYTTTVSGSYIISLSESVVYADNNNTIVLPSSPTTNESHWIVNIYTSDIVIDGNGKNIMLDGVASSTITLTPDSSLHVHFNSTKNRWYVI